MDGLGGPVGTVKIEGEGMSSFRIRVEFYKGDSKKLQHLPLAFEAFRQTIINPIALE